MAGEALKGYNNEIPDHSSQSHINNQTVLYIYLICNQIDCYIDIKNCAEMNILLHGGVYHSIKAADVSFFKFMVRWKSE